MFPFQSLDTLSEFTKVLFQFLCSESENFIELFLNNQMIGDCTQKAKRWLIINNVGHEYSTVDGLDDMLVMPHFPPMVNGIRRQMKSVVIMLIDFIFKKYNYDFAMLLIIPLKINP